MQKPLAVTATELDCIFARFLSKYARVGRSNIEAFAKGFCRHFGLHEIPLDPIQYLEHFGVHMEPVAMAAGIKAVWMRTGDSYIINYSRFLTGRLSLVLWHEFFEMMSSHPSFPTRLSGAAEERLATLFAVYVTMPEAQVRSNAAELGHPEIQDKTGVLASRFGVSVSAMRLRLKELGLEAKRKAADISSVGF